MISAELAARVVALGRALPGGLAAFDADGTLWREDIGEAFLRHLISLGWVTLPDGSDPFQAYERRVDQERAAGYAYATQLLAGLESARVAVEAESFARSWVPPRIIADTRALRELCARAGLRPVIISASAMPIVRAAAALAGFSLQREPQLHQTRGAEVVAAGGVAAEASENAHGIETRIDGGRFTSDLVTPVPYGAGKVQKAAALGMLALACGDSLAGDLALLEAARVAVVVAPALGSPLSLEARQRGWPVLDQDS